MAENEGKPSSCSLMALYNGLFRRRSPSAPPSPACPKRCRNATDEPTTVAHTPTLPIITGPTKTRTTVPKPQVIPHNQRPYQPPPPPPPQHHQQQPRGMPRSISKELESAIYDYQMTKGGSNLLRASSGNIMLHGQLGNVMLRGGNVNIAKERERERERERKIEEVREKERKKEEEEEEEEEEAVTLPPPSMCRALSKRLDPEELKEMGNEDYRDGRYAEALAHYDRAIAMDPKKAVYWSNKAAALTGLGKLLEAVAECKEAVKIDPSYKRAYHRLGTLFLRLGEPEKALRHYKQSGNEATAKDFSRVQSIQIHLNKSNEARSLKAWQTVEKEAHEAISMGADSAPLAFAAQAEALMKLQRYQEAEEVLIDAPKFDVDESTKFFGPSSNSYVLMIRAQVSLAAGRFEDAVSEAQWATRIDPSSKNAAAVLRRTKVMASSRLRGNDLFKAGRYLEACTAYGEGLDHDSKNPILLCNRAACRTKLGQWDKAVEDCDMALIVRPSYHKARLRRAECNLKMEKWEEALNDYEKLSQDLPGDEEVQKALSSVQSRLKQSHVTDGEKKAQPEAKTKVDVVVVKTIDEFVRIIHSDGTSVVLFCDEASESKQMMPFMAQLSRKYPSVHFLKVDKEELTNSEGLNSLPSFRIYQNGSKAKEINGADWSQLEDSIKNLIPRDLVVA